jgi:hypothetical protein
MSFEVAGSNWIVKTAGEHADAALTAINTELAPEGISLVASTANALWWVLLGLGQLAEDYDIALAEAKNSLSVALCTDDQLQNLLPVAGVTKIPGSYSTLSVNFTAGASPQSVTAGTRVKVANQSVYFVVDTTTNVPATTTVAIATTCDTIGPIAVLVGQVTGTVETLANITTVANSAAALPGSSPETNAEVRRRVLTGNTLDTNLDGVTRALRSLDGVQYAAVYFNLSTTTSLSLPGSISLAARTAYVAIKGTSALLAETYFSKMLAPTQGSSNQTYLTLSGQSLVFNYNAVVDQDVYITIYVSSLYPYSAGYATEAKNTAVTVGEIVTVGQLVTEELVLSVFDNFTFAVVTAATVSLNGSSWGRTAATPANAIPVFTTAHVTVTMEP